MSTITGLDHCLRLYTGVGWPSVRLAECTKGDIMGVELDLEEMKASFFKNDQLVSNIIIYLPAAEKRTRFQHKHHNALCLLSKIPSHIASAQ